MKRQWIALIVLLCFTTSIFAGCGKAEKEEPFTQGEMLMQICDAFGMYTYTTEKPYFENVNTDNPYFAAVQMCADWDIIDKNAGQFDVEADVTRGDLAIALVNAAVLTELSATDEEKLKAAANHSIVEAKSNGEIKTDKVVKRDEAEKAIEIAAMLWANKSFSENTQEVIYQDKVADFTNLSIIKKDGYLYLPNTVGTITEGNIFVYNTANGLAVSKVDSVQIGSGAYAGYYIVTEKLDDLKLEDVFEELTIQESFTPDLLKAAFTDGNGVVYEPEIVSQARWNNGNLFLPPANEESNVQHLNGNATKKFKVDNVEVELKMSSDDVEVKLTLPTEKDSKGNKVSEIYGSIKLSDLKFTNDIDYKAFQGITSLTTKMDYDVEVSSGSKETFLSGRFAPYNNGNGGFLSNLMRSEFRQVSEGGAKSIKIGSWTFYEMGIAQLKLELKAEFKVSGEYKLKFEISGAKGIEYRKGSGIRVIKDKSTDTDFEIKAKAEAVAGPGVALKLLNNWDVIEVAGRLGIGAEVSHVVHLVDEENHLIDEYTAKDLSVIALQEGSSLQIPSSPKAIENAAYRQGVYHYISEQNDVYLNLDSCQEARIYWIARIEIRPAELLPVDKLSVDLFDKKAKEIAKYHVENFDFLNPLDECTKEFKPFEDSEEPDEKEITEDKRPQVTDEHTVLDITTYSLVLKSEAQQIYLDIEEGESVPEVIWSSSDTSVAMVDANGLVTPVAEGNAIITVTLRENPSVYVKCAVYVQALGEENWEFLPADMELSV